MRIEPLILRDGDDFELARRVRSRSIPSGAAQRARIILLASRGESNLSIAELVGVSRPTVISWRARYDADGLAGLEDDARSGRPRSLDHREIVSATLMPPPKKYGVTHWSSRLLATHLGIGYGTVARIWREYGVQPWRSETFKFSTDPELVAKVTDMVGLYLDPPENAIVLRTCPRSVRSSCVRARFVSPSRFATSASHFGGVCSRVAITTSSTWSSRIDGGRPGRLAADLGVTTMTVSKWRKRFAQSICLR